jgi:predicted exporter
VTGGPRNLVRLSAWAAFALVCLAVVFSRLELSYDLSYFLPEADGPDEQLLRDRAGDAPGSRLLFAIVTAPEAATAEEVAVDLSLRLQGADPFTRVLAVSQEAGLDDIPPFAWKYRYLLDDRTLTPDSLREAIAARLGDVLMLSSPALVRIVKADPTMASLRVLERLDAGGEMQPSFPVGDRFGSLVLAETRAPAFDLGGQRQALDELRAGFSALNETGAGLEVFGMGVYGLGVQETIRQEATFRSILATFLVLSVLFAAFRKVSWVGAAGLPVALGLLAGLAAIALIFGKVHGITIAFGITILGITVDYPVHLLGHAREVGLDRAIDDVMPAIGIGAASTAIAYLGLALTGSSGLAQLAVFSLVGVVVAAVATRWFLPMLPLPGGAARDTRVADEAGPALSPRLSYLPAALALVACGIGMLQVDRFWSDDLSALTPIPAQTLRRDHELRQATGAPDLRYVIIAEGATRDEALSLAEELTAKLEEARARGIVERWMSPDVLLPSESTQRHRAAGLPPTELLASWLDQAVLGTPFSTEVFEPFMADVESSRSLELTAASVLDSPFAGVFESMLYEARGRWTALTTLHGPVDFAGLAEWSSRAGFSGNVHVVDLKAASESLVARYRAKVSMVIGLAATAILVLLIAAERRFSRALWIVATALAGLGLTIITLSALTGPLSVFHFVALLVVAGLGLDYGLFSSRPSTVAERKHTRRAVLVCVASTTATFGVLAFSSIPVLGAIGTTITTGCLICWGLARLGSARLPGNPGPP